MNRVGLVKGALECQRQGVPEQGWRWSAPHARLSQALFQGLSKAIQRLPPSPLH